jgi:uroporphyrin-III C-methyltransferase
MGLHNFQKISIKLMEIGKPPEYPCAAISKGTTQEQVVV